MVIPPFPPPHPNQKTYRENIEGRARDIYRANLYTAIALVCMPTIIFVVDFLFY